MLRSDRYYLSRLSPVDCLNPSVERCQNAVPTQLSAQTHRTRPRQEGEEGREDQAATGTCRIAQRRKSRRAPARRDGKLLIGARSSLPQGIGEGQVENERH